MKPKEKAKELVDNYYDLFSIQLENTINYREAKECALIAADECLHTCVESMIYFWQEVKQEIESL
jgi:hypothetical protein